jgi:hypothetical protein
MDLADSAVFVSLEVFALLEVFSLFLSLQPPPDTVHTA